MHERCHAAVELLHVVRICHVLVNTNSLMRACLTLLRLCKIFEPKQGVFLLQNPNSFAWDRERR